MGGIEVVDANTIRIDDAVEIPASELWFTASRSGGPGGQHANKVSTRVTLHFDLAGSPALSEEQRWRIGAALAGRVNRDGILTLTSRTSRSQAANKAEVVERFVALLQGALRPRKHRRATRPSAASVRRRVEDKRRRGAMKRARGRLRRDDG